MKEMPRLELNKKKGRRDLRDIEGGRLEVLVMLVLLGMERWQGQYVGGMFWASPNLGLLGSLGVEGAANELSEASTPSSLTVHLSSVLRSGSVQFFDHIWARLRPEPV